MSCHTSSARLAVVTQLKLRRPKPTCTPTSKQNKPESSNKSEEAKQHALTLDQVTILDKTTMKKKKKTRAKKKKGKETQKTKKKPTTKQRRKQAPQKNEDEEEATTKNTKKTVKETTKTKRDINKGKPVDEEEKERPKKNARVRNII